MTYHKVRARSNIDREFLIASLRCAKLRIALLGNQLDVIGVAVKGALMTPEDAVCALDDIGAWPFLDPEIGLEQAASERAA